MIEKKAKIFLLALTAFSIAVSVAKISFTGTDGSPYILDYGSRWTDNSDGQLIHVAWGGAPHHRGG